jgi:hypothetical protein
MNSIIQRIRTKRQKFLIWLNTNRDHINLDIFEDFYPDGPRFLYELLQNARDVNATEALFMLSKEGCQFIHNGQPFTELNVEMNITAFTNSSKKRPPTRSASLVLVSNPYLFYTDSPEIQSGNYFLR